MFLPLQRGGEVGLANAEVIKSSVLRKQRFNQLVGLAHPGIISVLPMDCQIHPFAGSGQA
jgi:hypothetical protein